jgi:hypothetical protein
MATWAARRRLGKFGTFKIVDAAKLPLAVRRHPLVCEAMEKVVRAMVKGGERKIAGVKIFPVTKSTVR